MDLSGCVVTADAINCQKNIADAILESKGDFLLACKANQAYLKDAAVNVFEQREENLKMVPDASSWYHDYVSECKGHGRIERREVSTFGQPGGGDYLEHELQAPQEWKGINALVKVCSTRTDVATGKSSTETRYYLTSIKAEETQRIAESIRGHWSIENELHWQLDVTFGEDDAKRIGNAALNFSLINKIVLSVIKRYKLKSGEKRSMKVLRKRASIKLEFLTKMLELAVWDKSEADES